MEPYAPTARTTVRRLPKRAFYDRETVHAILDEGLICHAAFVVNDSPVVIPTLYGRDGEQLFVHGSAASRMLRSLAGAVEVCVAVSIVDGLVLARSAFHHSINYRSVVLFGRARPVEDPIEKNEALRVISDHIVPGRWAEVREPTPNELKATSVLAIPLEEVSAKVRTGPPVDDEEDYEIPVWAGVLPLSLQAGTPVDDGRVLPGVVPSEVVTAYARRRS